MSLAALLERRLVIMDGAMGTMIQRHTLSEEAFRGDRFAAWRTDMRGNNDVLAITQPHIIAGIHRAYLNAGADIISTNTFNSTSISQADYGLSDIVVELNEQAARLARAACDAMSTSSRPRLVAGVIGPLWANFIHTVTH